MAIAQQLISKQSSRPIPSTMLAAVDRGINDVRLETVPVPQIAAGEILVRVHTCGICGTDLKKIATGSHSAPRIFGHETSGTVAAIGTGVTQFSPGDRVMVFHHIPCGRCYYCLNKTFAQCETYKKVGCTAGFEPSGGGFAEYVRVMDWIVQRGTVRIPDETSFEQASFVEPINTCMKGIDRLHKAGLLERGFVRNADRAALNNPVHYADVLGKAAARRLKSGSAAHFLIRFALGKSFVQAVITSAAGDMVKHHDAVARRELGDARADRGHSARSLVAEDARR